MEPPWILNHSVHCSYAMEMSWESNRVVLPCTGFHSVRQFSKVQKFYQCGFLLVQQLAQRHGRPSFMVVPEIVCSRGCSAAPLTWGMWFHVYMCRCFWEYRQEYETDTDTESAVWVSYSCLYSWPQVGWTLKNSQGQIYSNKCIKSSMVVLKWSDSLC